MVHTYSLPPAWDLTLSHREGRFCTPPHSHRLSHVSSWRTEEESYLMPCLMRRGHRNRLQNNSLKKFKKRTVSHHSLVRKIRRKLREEEISLLFQQLNKAAFQVCWDGCECVLARDNNHTKHLMTFQFHTCCQSNAIKKKTLLHFSQVPLCSLAPLLPHIFSCLPRSSRLSRSPSPLPLSPLSVRLLVFRTQQLPCPYCTVCAISEWSCLLVQPACELCWSQTTASWLWLYGGRARTQKRYSWHLKEREKQKEMRQKNIHWHRRDYYSYRCFLALKQKAQIQFGFRYFSPFFLWRHTLRLWNITQAKAGSWESWSVSLN